MNLEIVAGRGSRSGGHAVQVGSLHVDQFAVFVGEQYTINGRIQERLGQLRTTGRDRRFRTAP
jgi:hypothetical protein